MDPPLNFGIFIENNNNIWKKIGSDTPLDKEKFFRSSPFCPNCITKQLKMRKKYEYISIHVSILILHLIYFGILFLADEGNYLLVSNFGFGKISRYKWYIFNIRLTRKSIFETSSKSKYMKYLS